MPSIDVLDSTIHYEEHGSGPAIVFLHGKPSSSHMWRKILPLVGAGRLIAPTSSAWAARASRSATTGSTTTPAT
ncbi:hypothetical protein ACFQ08_11055 [Streptosporangium algeriense]|uniref:Haloalkane dehalogenase n=1 Tax=Streptosporangium algeriense TaxID=1682748 RepID=A0ABW3DQY9_9ACTN